MKKSSLGRRSSNRPSVQLGRPSNDAGAVRKSGIPLSRGRAQSSDRLSANRFPGKLSRANSSSNLQMKSGIPLSSSRAWSTDRLSSNRFVDSNLFAMDMMTPGRTPLSSRSTVGTARPARTTSYGTPSASIGTSSYGGAKTKRDNRPLQDKEWQAEAVSFIESILNQDPRGVGRRLKPLSVSNFLEACNILLQIMDKKVKITKDNYIQELPFLLTKKMQYQGKIEKSWMIAVSTHHAVPYAVGLLHFLASCANVFMNFDIESLMFPKKFDKPTGELNFQILIPFFNRSYELRLTNPENAAALQEELNQQVIREHYEQDGAQTKSNELQEERKALELQYEKLIHERDLLNQENLAKQNHYKSVENTMSELKDGLARSRVNINSYKTELVEITRALSLYQSDVKTLKEERDHLSKKAGALSVTNIKLENFKKRRESIERDIVSNKKYIDSYQEMIFTEDIDIVRLKNEIEELTRESNVKVMKYIPLEPSLSKMILPSKLEELCPSLVENAKFEECKQKHQSRISDFKSQIAGAENKRKQIQQEFDDTKAAILSKADEKKSLQEECDSLAAARVKEEKDLEAELQKLYPVCEELAKQAENYRIKAEETSALVMKKQKDLKECEKLYQNSVEKRTKEALKLMKQVNDFLTPCK